MKNKILISLVAVLAGALIFQTAYLIGSRNSKEPIQKIIYLQHKPFTDKRFFNEDSTRFNMMRSWDPFQEMNLMQQRMDRIFTDTFRKSQEYSDILKNNISVKSGISFNTTADAYLVKANLPVADKKDINIEVNGRNLVITSKTKKEQEEKTRNSYNAQSSYNNFLSSFMLPEDAKIDKITSDFKNGVLTITVPREVINKQAAKKAVKVPVK